MPSHAAGYAAVSLIAVAGIGSAIILSRRSAPSTPPTTCPSGDLPQVYGGCPQGYVPDPKAPGCCVQATSPCLQGGCSSACPCPAGSTCSKGFCVSNCAGQPCSASCPCPPGTTCDPTTGLCRLPTHCTQGHCSSTCPCPSGQTCQNGLCVTPAPSGCGGGSPCPNGKVCYNGLCVSTCGPCTAGGCPAGCTCHAITGSVQAHACVPNPVTTTGGKNSLTVSPPALGAFGTTGWPWLDTAPSPFQAVAPPLPIPQPLWDGPAPGGWAYVKSPAAYRMTWR